MIGHHRQDLYICILLCFICFRSVRLCVRVSVQRFEIFARHDSFFNSLWTTDKRTTDFVVLVNGRKQGFFVFVFISNVYLQIAICTGIRCKSIRLWSLSMHNPNNNSNHSQWMRTMKKYGCNLSSTSSMVSFMCQTLIFLFHESWEHNSEKKNDQTNRKKNSFCLFIAIFMFNFFFHSFLYSVFSHRRQSC